MLRKVKAFVFRNFLETNHQALNLARFIQFRLWKAKMALRGRAGSENGAAHEPLYVDPSLINGYIGNLPWNRFDMRGLVKGGDWDLGATPFEGWDLCGAMRAHFEEGLAWEETDFYKRVTSELEAGKSKWGCTTPAAFQERLAGIDRLYHTIATEGYKTKAELAQEGDAALSWEPDSPFDPYDDVVVCIDRNGRFLLRDGKHRLMIAKLLGLKRIPVVVGLRHADWVAFKREVRLWVKKRGGTSYQPFTHPDLHFKSLHDERRAGLLCDHLPADTEKVLDIGAFFGYFCHILEQRGKQCTAVEFHPENVYFLRKLREAEGRTFEVFAGSIFDFGRVGDYDTILALNIFHHFIKTPGLLDNLRVLLRDVKAKYMFFEPHLQSDLVMQNAFYNPAPDEFADFVMENAGFTKKEFLATVDRGRSLYLLSR